MKVDRAKLAFLAAVGLCAAAIGALLAELPETWRTAAILWLLCGVPSLLFVLRVWQGYCSMVLADLARSTRERPAAPSRAGGQQGAAELHVIETSDGGGRRLL